MSESTLGKYFRIGCPHHERPKIEIAGLSKEDFLKAYDSDPFFRARVQVELEKIVSMAKDANLMRLLEEERRNASDNDEMTLKKKSSLDYGKEFEKYEQYIHLLTAEK
jgi:hypothetical protein